jgi:diaminopimelate decarboxylase
VIEISPGRLTLGGIDARALAERWGTPLFVYDADEVRASFRRIRGAFRYEPSHVHFAAVCNPNLHLLRLLREQGALLHANTPGDVYCGLRAGYPPSQIVFSGSNLGEEDLAYLLRAGVHLNVDSLDDLRRVAELSPGRDLGLRVHLAGTLPESRIGVREHELGEALALARQVGSRITALHVYCGTHGQSLQRYRESLARLVELALQAPDVDCINLGGGFGYDYRDPDEGAFPFEALARAADSALRDLSLRLGRPVTLRVEPGRALVAGSAVLLTRVRSVKREEARRYVGVDTTTANFTSPVVHGARRRVVSVAERPPAETLADVCGSTTYSRDFVTRDAPLPEVRVGDLLAVMDVGAYGYCMSSHFLNRPRAAEVFVDTGDARLVTRRETFEDLVAAQVEPGEGAV